MDKTNIYLSCTALFISIISLSRQIYVEWISNIARLKIKLSIGRFSDMKEQKSFFDVTISNKGKRIIYINRPFLCITGRNPYYKRFDKSPLIEFPYKLEPWSNIKIAIADLVPEKDGQYKMDKGDALMINDTMLLFDNGSKFFPSSEPEKESKVKPKKTLKSFVYKFKPNKTLKSSAYIEISDSNNKKYKSKKLAITYLIKQEQELNQVYNVKPSSDNQ